MEDAQPRPIAEAVVDLDQVHGSAAAAWRAARVDPALFLRQTIGVFLAQLQVEMLAREARCGEGILRRHAAIVMHLHLNIFARQHRFAEIGNFREVPASTR